MVFCAGMFMWAHLGKIVGISATVSRVQAPFHCTNLNAAYDPTVWFLDSNVVLDPPTWWSRIISFWDKYQLQYICKYTNYLLSTKSLPMCDYFLSLYPHIPWCFSQVLSFFVSWMLCAGKTQSFTSAEWDRRILGTTPVWRRTRWAEKTPPASSASKAVRALLFPSLQMAHRRPAHLLITRAIFLGVLYIYSK